jgi:AhpD family alkylhydroperoxidase
MDYPCPVEAGRTHDGAAEGITSATTGESRRFASLGDAAKNLAGVAAVSVPLARVYRGSLDPALRERIMVAVSEANACAGCTRVHQKWAVRAGVSDEELYALGLGELSRLDERSRAAVVYAVERSQSDFAGEPPAEIAEAVADRFTATEIGQIEAVARAMTMANLTVGTVTALKARLPDFG